MADKKNPPRVLPFHDPARQKHLDEFARDAEPEYRRVLHYCPICDASGKLPNKQDCFACAGSGLLPGTSRGSSFS